MASHVRRVGFDLEEGLEEVWRRRMSGCRIMVENVAA
jgi:hypothetical protein